MELFNIIAVLTTLSALFGYLNHRYIKLPTTIGLMLISILMSLVMVILGHLGHIGYGIEKQWLGMIRNIDFNKTLMVGMLSFLLFAGALHVDLHELLKQKWQIGVLATIGVILSLVTASYAFSTVIHTSGPIAIVVAGLFIGNHGRQFAMSKKTRENLDMFWELIDEILNALLFVLIGLELLVITLNVSSVLAGVIAIPVVLCARLLSVGVPQLLMSMGKKFDFKFLRIMTWGGLRGGISVALALSLPAGFERDSIITMTYTVVVFSIMVQGLTIKYLIGHSAEVL